MFPYILIISVFIGLILPIDKCSRKIDERVVIVILTEQSEMNAACSVVKVWDDGYLVRPGEDFGGCFFGFPEFGIIYTDGSTHVTNHEYNHARDYYCGNSGT